MQLSHDRQLRSPRAAQHDDVARNTGQNYERREVKGRRIIIRGDKEENDVLEVHWDQTAIKAKARGRTTRRAEAGGRVHVSGHEMDADGAIGEASTGARDEVAKRDGESMYVKQTGGREARKS